MIMIKAGNPVDQVIGELAPLLEKGDVIIDGGNSLFTDTQRRCKDLEGNGIHFVGMRRFRRRRRRAQRSFADARWFARILGNHRADFSQDRRPSRWRTVLPLHGPGRRRALRQDGAQRNRVRRHAADLRSLRDSEGRGRHG